MSSGLGGGGPPHKDDPELIQKMMRMMSARGSIGNLTVEEHGEQVHEDAWKPGDFSGDSGGRPFPNAWGQMGRDGWYDHSNWEFNDLTDQYEPPSDEIVVINTWDSLK